MTDTNWVAEMVKDTLRKQDEFKEDLLRDHFSETPIALACVERLNILPWDIEVQEMRDRDAGWQATHLTFSLTARVVEYTPRRWEMHSVRAKENERVSDIHTERIRAAIDRLRTVSGDPD